MDSKPEEWDHIIKELQDSASRIAKETACYAVEIQRAQDLGLDNVVKQLQENLQNEIKKFAALRLAEADRRERC